MRDVEVCSNTHSNYHNTSGSMRSRVLPFQYNSRNANWNYQTVIQHVIKPVLGVGFESQNGSLIKIGDLLLRVRDITTIV